jgi:hypothetical protein
VVVRTVRGAVRLERDDRTRMRQRAGELHTATPGPRRDLPDTMPRVAGIPARAGTGLFKAAVGHVHPGAGAALRKDIAR